ncbi:L-threonine 3-dehydrogenase [invertebrate metagenome]|uniref:L-threonine 3-dehydrogenase n=1 Tax=invertebrate metagenome TaxID=1711999 RepID=A0A2H9TC60_9ZZZZ
MKTLAKLKPEKGIWMVDHPMPKMGHSDVLIKIKKTAICGTDIHIYNWNNWAQQTIPVGMHVGHEYMGQIVDMGSEVKGLSIGQRVSGEGHITCGHCRNCRAGRTNLCNNAIGTGVNREGAFAEYLCIPAFNVFPLPDAITDEQASIFDPLGNATYTALSFDLVAEDVLITGAGPIGIMAGTIAKHAGARHVVVTDVNDYRLDLAHKLGADRVVNVARDSLNDVMKELDIVEGFDVGMEMSGSPAAINQMFGAMNHGGHVALLGIPDGRVDLDIAQVMFKGLKIKGLYGREMFETWYKMSTMLQSGLNVNDVITHRYSIDDYQEAFEVMASGNAGKVILDWEN